MSDSNPYYTFWSLTLSKPWSPYFTSIKTSPTTNLSVPIHSFQVRPDLPYPTTYTFRLYHFTIVHIDYHLKYYTFHPQLFYLVDPNLSYPHKGKKKKVKVVSVYSPPSLTCSADLSPPGQLPPLVIGPDTHTLSGFCHAVLRQLFTALQHRDLVTWIACPTKYPFPLGGRRPFGMNFIEVAEASRNCHRIP